MAQEFVGRGLAFPLRTTASGSVALVSADQELREAIRLILGTAYGERPMRPEFGCGIHDYIFESIDAEILGSLQVEIRDALDRWEPRIEVLDIDVDLSHSDDGLLLIDITYAVRATNDVRNLVYPFYVIPAEESE